LQQLFNSKIDDFTHDQYSDNSLIDDSNNKILGSFGNPQAMQRPGTRASQEPEFENQECAGHFALGGQAINISSKYDQQYGQCQPGEDRAGSKSTRGGEGSSSRILRREQSL